MTIAAELPTLWATTLEAAFNHALTLVPDTRQALAQFEGKVIALQIRGTEVRAFLRLGAESVDVMAHFAGEADTTLVGSPLGFARLALGQQASQVLFSGSVEIRGDVDLGQDFKQVLDQMEVDWEEHLSRLTGDVAAHELGRLVRGAQAWTKQAIATLGADVSDYLHYEGEDLPAREQVEQFVREVETLRDDVARLEARVRRLRRQTHSDADHG